MPRLSLSTLVLLLTAMVAFAVAFFWDGMPRGLGPPQESNRVFHSAGFSIVAPEGWKVFVERAELNWPDSISIRPDTRSRYHPMIHVESRRGELDPEQLADDGYKPASFQGKTAFRKEGAQGKYWSHFITFERSGIQYTLDVLLPDPPSQGLPPLYEQYLNSFAVHGPVTQPATTQSNATPKALP